MSPKDFIDEPDIMKKIRLDFGDEAGDAIKMIRAAIEKHDHLNHARIIRCIVFLANKDLGRLAASVNDAITDPRDVMLWAEYIREDDNPVRVRDFNNIFPDA